MHLDRARTRALERDSTSVGSGKGGRSPRCPAAVRGDEPGRDHCPSGWEGTGRGGSPSQKTCAAEASRRSFRAGGARWIPRRASAAGARLSGPAHFGPVSSRGSWAGQAQVYLDGLPLGRAQNETVNLADLPLDAVDHVEVYRGTTPLAFAQSGPGGIVNVVTRRPGDTPLTGASVSYGSFTTRKVDVARSARAGDVDYLAFAHYLGSEGDFSFLNDLGTTANPADDRVERRRNNAFDLGDLTARLGWCPEGGPLAAAPTTATLPID